MIRAPVGAESKIAPDKKSRPCTFGFRSSVILGSLPEGNLRNPSAFTHAYITDNKRRDGKSEDGTRALPPRSYGHRMNSTERYSMKTHLAMGLLAILTATAFAQTSAPPANPKPATPAVATSNTPP